VGITTGKHHRLLQKPLQAETMTKYFIKYEEKEDINYIYLLCLYNIAQYNPKEKRYNIIKYTSLKDLQGQIKERNNYNISTSTLTRLLHDSKYYKYFEINPKEKEIKLLNNCRGCNKFVVLNHTETRFLIE